MGIVINIFGWGGIGEKVSRHQSKRFGDVTYSFFFFITLLIRIALPFNHSRPIF
jgi:hypothetical protein